MYKYESNRCLAPERHAFRNPLRILSNPTLLAKTAAIRARYAAQERERHLEDGRYVDVLTGDPEKDYFSVGRMWLTGG